MKPILFNTEMVKAILDGRKTQTRRDPFHPDSEYEYKGLYRDIKNRLCAIFQHSDGTSIHINANYEPGDILWVRETWIKTDVFGSQNGYLYRANKGQNAIVFNATGQIERWRSSIHMPKEAARIFLWVTGVRVERVQDISFDDALAEGLSAAYGDDDFLGPKAVFSRLWDNTIKPKDREHSGWAANPWVWVYEFERISEEEIAHEK